MSDIPNRFYRISMKALILNEARDKFLICRKESGLWEFPGGGLDWGEEYEDNIRREIEEEMSITVKSVAKYPSYFVTGRSEPNRGVWIANVLYETELETLDFKPSDECVEIRFVNINDVERLDVFVTVEKVAKLFDSSNH